MLTAVFSRCIQVIPCLVALYDLAMPDVQELRLEFEPGSLYLDLLLLGIHLALATSLDFGLSSPVAISCPQFWPSPL